MCSAEDLLGRLAIDRCVAVAVDELRERARGVLHHDLTCGRLLRGQGGVAAGDPGAQVVLAHLLQDLLPGLLVNLRGVTGWRGRGVRSSVGGLCVLRGCRGGLHRWLHGGLLSVFGLGVPRLGLLSRRLSTAGRRAGLRLCHGASTLALIRSRPLRCLTCSRLLRCLARVRAGSGTAAVHDLPCLAGLGDRRVLVLCTGSVALLPGRLRCGVHILSRWRCTLLLLRVIHRLLGACCLRGLLHSWLLRLRRCLPTDRSSALSITLLTTLVRRLLGRLSGLCGLTSPRGLTGGLRVSVAWVLWLLRLRTLWLCALRHRVLRLRSTRLRRCGLGRGLAAPRPLITLTARQARRIPRRGRPSAHGRARQPTAGAHRPSSAHPRALLQRLNTLRERLHRHTRGRKRHPRAQNLQQQPRRRRPTHLRETIIDHRSTPRQRRRPQRLGLLPQRVLLLLRNIHQPALESIRHRLNNQQVTEAIQQIHRKATRVVTGVDDVVDNREQARLILGSQRLRGTVQQRRIRHAQQRHRALIGHALRARTGEQLIQDGQRITRRTPARAHDQRIHGILNHRALVGDDAPQQAAHIRRGEQPERVVVRPRPDRRQQLLRLRGREDEDEVLRRLLHDLQEGVEALRGDHVRLIDDEHAVAGISRRVERPVAQLPHVVHTAVGGGVQLGDVQAARAARGERDTGIALPARRRRRPLHTVQRAREDACRGGLTATARAREQVRMVDAPAVQRDGQRLGYMLLPHDLGKRGRAVLPV